MSNFYIKKLSIFGEGKKPSYVEFGKGLNIVHGVSDTGKTCIINCIDFVFGSSNAEPIPNSHGYTYIQLLIETDNGVVTLERIIGKNKVKVISSNPLIKSNEYSLKEMGTMLLSLIGITNSPMIIKNGRYDKVRLTWRTFMHSFLIKEEEVIQTQPILISKESTVKTSSMSGLLYLISAPDFNCITPNEDKKIKEARKRAVEAYIHEELSFLNEQKTDLDKRFADIDSNTIEKAIPSLVDELSTIENRIAQEINKSKGTLSKVFAQRDRLAECDLLLSRYAELRSQYVADIKRLSFIVDGEINMSLISTPEKCPFCDGAMPEHKHTTYIEASNGELDRITRLLNDLAKTEKTVLADRIELEKKLFVLSTERVSIENYIKNELKPKAQTLKIQLQEYRAFVRLQNELELIEKLKKEKTNKLNDMLVASEEATAEYKPREHFPNGFDKEITDLFITTLKACKYENLVGAVFSMQTFDVIVNAKKKENYGKGYRAFLNVVLAIVMRDYLSKQGKFAPHLLIVDSPLLSLEQGVDDVAPESMKAALIEYLMKTQTVGQTIIVENKIPNLNYNDYDVTIHNFTKGKSEGRYGLLADVHD